MVFDDTIDDRTAIHINSSQKDTLKSVETNRIRYIKVDITGVYVKTQYVIM